MKEDENEFITPTFGHTKVFPKVFQIDLFLKEWIDQPKHPGTRHKSFRQISEKFRAAKRMPMLTVRKK